MRTVCKTVFKLDELNAEARVKALEEFALDMEYPEYADVDNTLRNFQRLFDVTIREYEVGYDARPYVKYYINNTTPDFSDPIRLRTWIINNYYDCLFRGKYYGKLKGGPGNYRHIKRYSKVQREKYAPTGYYLDYTVTDPIRQFLDNPYQTTWYELIGDCLTHCLDVVEKDIQYFYSEENIETTIANNDIEFYETGEMY